MAFQDFTISFTTTELAEFNNFAEGNISSYSTIFADIAAFNNISMFATLFADIAAFNNIAMFATLSADGIEPLFIQSDIIHYGDQSAFKAEDIVLGNEVVLRGQGQLAWEMENVKLNVIDSQVDRILNIDESKSVVINNGAGSGIDLSLPGGAPAGVVFTFIRTSTSGSMVVNSDGIGAILDASGVLQSGVTLNSIGSKLSVMSIGGLDEWLILNSQDTTSTPAVSGGLASLIRDASFNFDASVQSTLTLGTPPDVNLWSDLNANGFNVGAGPDMNKPHTGGNINGLNTLVFDNVAEDFMTKQGGGNGFAGLSGDFYAVVELSQIGNFRFLMTSSDDASLLHTFIIGTDNSDRARIGVVNAGVANIVTSTNPLSLSTSYLLRFYSDGGTYFIEINGVNETLLVAAGSNTGEWFGDISSRDNFVIGMLIRSIGFENSFGGKMGQLIYFDDRVLDNTEKTLLTDYLKTKWGI